jgi:hypothetical protein
MVLKVVSGGNFNGPIYYQGTWDANANNPFLQSGVGFTGEYYIVSVAGNTNLDGISNWQVGDWAIFNSATNKWEKIDGGSYGTTLNIVNDSSSNTSYNVVLTNSSGGLVDTEYVNAGNLTYYPGNSSLFITSNVGNYGGNAIRLTNQSPGNSAISSIAYFNDKSTPIFNHGVIGITGSNLTNSNYLFAPNQFIMYSHDIDLVLGTYAANKVRIVMNQQNVDAITVTSNNSIGFSGSYGTSGQVLTSQGSTSAPIWSTPANGTVVSISSGTGITATPNPITNTGTIAIANTTVTAGTYGNASAVSQVVINAQGQVTSASNVTISVPSGQVTGLGTMATQNSNNVTITGGSINVQTTNHTATTTGNATYATSSLLLVPAGFFEIDLNGTVVKVPYYAV